MLTTTEVRAIMRKHGRESIWTNKAPGHAGNVRTVKCYEPWDFDVYTRLSRELCKKAGRDNVSFTSGGGEVGMPGIVVKCVIA